MKYFSRIELDEQHAGARRAVVQVMDDSAYGDHQLLWRFFPAPDGSARSFLFRRCEPQGGRRQPRFYCVSDHPALAPHPAWRVDSRAYEPRIGVGEHLWFDLRINPTQARKRDGKSRRDDVVMHGKRQLAARYGVARWADLPEVARIPLYELAHGAVSAWLGDPEQPGIAARHGFQVQDDLRVDGYRQHRFHRGSGREIMLSTVDLSGTLRVTDAALFTRALVEGVGHAKAFGCGLLLVRRG